ncbi:MAG: preprotein translocase subunit SecA [Oscillospiraceae bacterium]|jgi:preprotein translocase subunit SecA|nr:preprotein translocase subunit SecA [Oscillospiraceae bacterium]
MNILKSLFGNYSKRELKKIEPLKNAVLEKESVYEAMSDKELQAQTDILKERLKNGETLDDILPDAFAVCREASWRVIGLKHFPVQIVGGIILHQGRIAEMKTGEGKTLVATLPSYLNALTGEGVHIVTVNEYLARRDSEWMGKVHRWLGLTVGLVTTNIKNDERRKAYACDITYGTNNEFGFDYLRDNMVPYIQLKVQRGHVFAVVDEVDSILIDEARTPLIISGQGEESTELYTRANEFARRLKQKRMVADNEKQEIEDRDDVSDADYVVDEKAKTVTLTERGVKKAESYFSLENLSDTDEQSQTISHHVNQAIRAHGIMIRDIDYVVQDGEVIIVDEFTGRLMYGRRYNDGLHQAIEAKEGVKVAHESKTLATITFQNYFRLYKKLSGMTGTALTEEEEFREIYRLDSIEVPTNKPMARIDNHDIVYATEAAKFRAVIALILEAHKDGQPILVGTVSIEKSELLSSLLTRQGVKHQVLNAKQHAREAEIVAQAGKFGAVTIATNMAGRGTDIKLGGNSEFMAKQKMRTEEYSEEMIEEANSFGETDNAEIIAARKRYNELIEQYEKEIRMEAERVCSVGGLLIIGTERHESRRIDNQLRGRAGRQGDPGETQFYISLEDDLMRLFGGDRVKGVMSTISGDEDMPIQVGILSSMIENAQRNVEGRNFGIRKNVIKFDDVMNRQREIIYSQRDQVLNNEDLKDKILKMLEESITGKVSFYLTGDSKDDWNFTALRAEYNPYLTHDDDFVYTEEELYNVEAEYITNMLLERMHERYENKEKDVGSELMRAFERKVLLHTVDSLWMEHIDAMEELKKGIGLRAYGQKDPVVAYTVEGFDMFDEMIALIKDEVCRIMMTMVPRTAEQVERKQVAKVIATSSDGSDPSAKTVRGSGKVARNAPCPCGSGKKYKQCCGKDK